MYNFKYLVGGAALVLATSALAGGPEVAPAPVVDNSGFYIGVNGGLNLLGNTNNNDNWAYNGLVTVNGVTTFYGYRRYETAGWNLGGAIGYHFNNWRVEVEGSYMQHAANNSHNVFIANWGTWNNNDLQIVTVLLNGYYDFDMGNNFVPYVGLGLGWGQVQSRFGWTPFNVLTRWNNTITRNGFAFQGVLGLDYKITDNVRIGVAYHAVGITGNNNNNWNGNVIILNGQRFVDNNRNNFVWENKFNLGLSYFF